MSFDPHEIVNIAIDAGQAIMGVYDSSGSIEVETKNDDSPLTKADLAAHDAIIRGLALADPGAPVVSEEGRVGNPLHSELAWLVDPRDGTTEFIKRNGMFTVQIALMRREGEWCRVGRPGWLERDWPLGRRCSAELPAGAWEQPVQWASPPGAS